MRNVWGRMVLVAAVGFAVGAASAQPVPVVGLVELSGAGASLLRLLRSRARNYKG